MSTIRLQLAEYLKSRGFTPDSLVEVIPETVNPETIYQLIQKPENLHQIDLYRFRLHRNDLTTENAENTEGDKRDE
ncbi:hypothetical protein [Microcoleus sp.]|uniref:hypothetical protein n=1 Tax=Microcoleus sp. TaxID=44472 RepID=UPI003524423E